MVGFQRKGCVGRMVGTGHAAPSTSGARPLAEVWSDDPARLPPPPALASDRGAWEWRADFIEGGDVCSMPFDSYDRCQRDADDHARRYLATSGEGFRSITVRRVVH